MDCNYKQWIADIYHCSDSWGQKMTHDEMLINIIEWNKQTDGSEYCPTPELYKECAEYWNYLCDAYQN